MRTSREGRAAKAGHDLVIDVTGWSAEVDLDGGAVSLDVDPDSLRVREGVGGVKPLSAGDKEKIEQTIAGEVLHGGPLAFRSTSVDPGSPFVVAGELTLAGETRPLEVQVDVGDDGTATATVAVRQTDWGITPQSAMMGALRVGDEVQVALTVRLSR
ncbi:MAG TPA: YceI family protein [Gemmatimonadaceae bacterium]|nr:YceI family protein [Gemmatimonadaceae bacterium]